MPLPITYFLLPTTQFQLPIIFELVPICKFLLPYNSFQLPEQNYFYQTQNCHLPRMHRMLLEVDRPISQLCQYFIIYSLISISLENSMQNTFVQNTYNVYVQKFIMKLCQKLVLTVQNLTSFNLIIIKNLYLMISTERKQYNQIIYEEIVQSFQRLTGLLQHVTQPSLVEHCKIWKLQKGAKKLIQLAIQGDKLLTKQFKSLKKSISMEKNEESPLRQREKEKNSRKVVKKQIKQEFQQFDEDFKKVKKQVDIQEPVEKEQQKIIADQRYQSFESQKIKKEQFDEFYNEQLVKKEDISNCLFSFDSVEKSPQLKKQESKISKKYMRGPYKNYSRQMKQKVVQLYKSNMVPISRLSSQYGIPIKNIKRWAENGIDRKEGAGRKRLDPNMEDQLYEKIQQKYQEGVTIHLDQIRFLALSLSRVVDFKASKGWIMSFIQRYRLHNRNVIA